MKHVVLDIDGTILDSKHQLRETTKNYLLQLQKKGITVSLASGRTARRMQPIIDALEINGYCISGNGYKVFHTKKDEEYVVDSFSVEEINYYFDKLKQYEQEVYTFSDTQLYFYLPKQVELLKKQYIKDKKMPDDTSLVGGPYGFLFDHGNAYDVIKQVDVFTKSAYKICVRGENKILQRIQDDLSHENCQCMITTSEWLEICPTRNSKGNALRILCEKSGFDLKDVVAFGDGENDISMLEIVGKGFAMGNAIDTVKKRVSLVAPSNDEDGIVQVLNNIFE